MILYIDTTINNYIELNLKKNNIILIKKRLKVEFNETQKLLKEIDLILAKNNINLTKIKKIIINNRGGSFTSLRIGVVTANALGYALSVPVEGLEEGKKYKSKFNIVKPIYEKEPNITIGKKILC